MAHSFTSRAEERCRVHEHSEELAILSQGVDACDRLARDAGEEAHPAIADLFRRLAFGHLQYGNPWEAEKLVDRYITYSRQLALRDIKHQQMSQQSSEWPTLENSSNRYHIAVDETCHALGHAFARKGRHSTAVKLWETCLDLRNHTLGEAHPALSSMLDHLVRANINMNRHSEAIQRCEQLLGSRLISSVPGNPKTAEAYLLLGTLWQKEGEEQKSLWCYRKAAELREKIFGARDMETCMVYTLLRNFAHLRVRRAFEKGAREEEIKALRDAIKLHIRTLAWVRPGIKIFSTAPTGQVKISLNDETMQLFPHWVLTAHASQDKGLDLSQEEPSVEDLKRERKAYDRIISPVLMELGEDADEAHLRFLTQYLRMVASEHEHLYGDRRRSLEILTRLSHHLNKAHKEIIAVKGKEEGWRIKMLQATVLIDLGTNHQRCRGIDEAIVCCGEAIDILEGLNQSSSTLSRQQSHTSPILLPGNSDTKVNLVFKPNPVSMIVPVLAHAHMCLGRAHIERQDAEIAAQHFLRAFRIRRNREDSRAIESLDALQAAIKVAEGPLGQGAGRGNVLEIVRSELRDMLKDERIMNREIRRIMKSLVKLPTSKSKRWWLDFVGFATGAIAVREIVQMLIRRREVQDGSTIGSSAISNCPYMMNRA
eukprot:CAMPEP_0167760242 /NCGR_PEP_ID=MMETSP0110_2-20121227/11480_1 /TAXON_ID=629695 /ORGANISM="Gymnochlora sp., Strain CCMP2014" /LENGTH=653 /DNA_ID=CAMNT_0007646737 /DNA_START=167 /DNA_END=2128 /DNA_ORIENTATION=+